MGDINLCVALILALFSCEKLISTRIDMGGIQEKKILWIDDVMTNPSFLLNKQQPWITSQMGP